MAKLTVLFVLAVFSFVAGTPVTFDYDTIVIGGGAAGVGVASPVARAGRKVLLLEAQDRIGGRVWTAPFGDSVVELGAEWIHGTVKSTTYTLAEIFNVTIVPQELTYHAYRSDGSKGDSKLMNELVELALKVQENPPNPPEKLGEFITRKVREHLQEKHPEILNDEDFLNEFFRFLDQVICGYEAADSWNDVSSSSSYEELEGNQHMSWGKQGYKTFFDIILYRYQNRPGIPELTIKLNSPVTKVSWSKEGGGVSVTTADGTTYTAENVVVTVSVGVLKEKHSSLFSPPLPQEKIDAINKIAFGVCDKVVLRFNEDWWNGAGYGFIWKGEDRKKYSEEDSWLTSIDGVSPPMSVDKTLTVWFCGQAARTMESLPEEVVTTKVMGVIRKFLGKDFNVTDPVETIRSTWYNNPYIRGSYSYDNLEYPLHPNIRATLAEPLTDNNGVNRVLFAGESTIPHVFSTVHGAVESGYREAARLLGIDTTKEKIFSSRRQNA